MGFWNSTRRKGQQFAALTCADRRALLQALVLLPIATAGRHVMSYGRLRTVLSTLLPPRAELSLTDPEARAHAEQLARMVQIAAGRSPLRPSCLDRSLVLWVLLRRHGYSSTLRIGARKEGTRFEAHAWVEVNGVVVNDAEDVGRRFAAF